MITAATAYGITVQSCTLFASSAKPLSLMIVGSYFPVVSNDICLVAVKSRLTKRPKEYNPDKMAKYAVADSHIFKSSTPRTTSDHLKASCSASIVLLRDVSRDRNWKLNSNRTCGSWVKIGKNIDIPFWHR